MDWLPGIFGFFKEVSKSTKFQISAAVASGFGLVALLIEKDNLFVLLVSLCSFSAAMFICTLCEKLVAWVQRQEEKQKALLIGKAGTLGKQTYTHKLTEPYSDKQFPGLGWQILSNVHTRNAYLTDPICTECRSDLLAKLNHKVDGYYLECPDCKKRFDVDDIGKARAIADASLQGDFRKDSKKFFS